MAEYTDRTAHSAPLGVVFQSKIASEFSMIWHEEKLRPAKENLTMDHMALTAPIGTIMVCG